MKDEREIKALVERPDGVTETLALHGDPGAMHDDDGRSSHRRLREREIPEPRRAAGPGREGGGARATSHRAGERRRCPP